MLRADVPILELAAFFVCVKQDSFSERSKVQFRRLRDPLAKHYTLLDIAANYIDGERMIKREKPSRKILILTHQAEQDVFRGNYLRAILQSLVACEENNPA